MKTFVALLICLSLVSCTEETDFATLNIAYEDHLVIDAMITTEQKQQIITLSHTVDLSKSNIPRMESGAEVSISSPDTTLYLKEIAAGVYGTEGNWGASVNTKYVLNITLRNGSQYTASDNLYPAMNIDTMYYLEGEIYLKAHCLKNQGGAASILDFYFNDSLVTSTLKDKIIMRKGLVNESLISVSKNKNPSETPLRVKLRMYSLSYGMALYLEDMKNETIFSTEFFATSSANLRTNISSGGLGYFCVSDVKEKTMTLENGER